MRTVISSLLLCAFCILASGCGNTAQKREVKPVINPVIYVIPDWDTQNRERDIVASSHLSDKSVNIFLTPIPSGFITPYTLEMPEKSERRSYEPFDIVFITVGQNVSYIPVEDLKSKEDVKNRCIAVCKGEFTDKMVELIRRELSPDAYVFIKDHYEKRNDIKGKPAAVTGSGDFKTPFTGDFPHILKIEMKNTPIIRPIDTEGFLLNNAIVTTQTISQITAIIKNLNIQFKVEGWHKGRFDHTIEIPFTNPFADELDISISSKGNSPWKTTVTPSDFNIKSGRKGLLKCSFIIDSVKKVTPFPEITYTVTVGGVGAASGNIPVDIHRIPVPE